ncbi:MAG: hypothetical protein KME09_19885 [Pleurocapsa minor HA4230-MV1]|jgi:hypothetical protein|nr:hypothetical protein [Pleurocapsa minor HA4230-MV1]
MTTADIASVVNSASKTQSIEEISLVIAAQDLIPTMISQDFLKFSGIIPQDWELAKPPIVNPNFAQLNFINGVGITAQPRTISLSESLHNKQWQDITINRVAEKYLEKLPHAEYMGLSFSPKILLPFPNAPQAVRQYITESLLGSGGWKYIGNAPLQAGINLMYQLERCQMTISISEAKLQKPQETPIAAVLFSGNFNYNVNLNQAQSSKITQMTNFLNYWRTDLEEFREIVNQKFLDSTEADETQFVGAMSLFPGQML